MPDWAEGSLAVGRAAAIVRALRGRWYGAYGVARCPAHEDREPSLSVREEGGRLLWHCHAGCTWDAVLAAFRQSGVWDGVSPVERHWSSARGSDRARLRSVLRVWQATTPGPGSLVQRYLAARRLALEPPPSLRFAPSLKHHPSGSAWPVMVAAVVDVAGQITAVHRTYLRSDGTGKAPVEPSKMMLGTVQGGAVRLADAIDHVAIAEGIETAAAVQIRTGMPTWAALSAGGIEAIQLPRRVRTIVIAADGDARGREAASKAAGRLSRQGRRVEVLCAPEGQDFADLAGVA